MSSPGVATTVPTVGTLTLPGIAVSGTLANRPKANGTNGLYYAVDQGNLYFDLGMGIPGQAGYTGQWVQIFTGGPITT